MSGKIILIITILFSAFSMQGQIIVRGLITDYDHAEIPYANIVVGSPAIAGATTDVNGFYSISLPDSLFNQKICISVTYLGVSKTRKKFKLKNHINFWDAKLKLETQYDKVY